MSASRAVEIAVQDLAGIRTALTEGADRIELCMGLGVGGLTPSIGLIESAVDAARGTGAEGFVHALIRPRGGDFVYNEHDLAVATRDIHRAVSAGVDRSEEHTSERQSRGHLVCRLLLEKKKQSKLLEMKRKEQQT